MSFSIRADRSAITLDYGTVQSCGEGNAVPGLSNRLPRDLKLGVAIITPTRAVHCRVVGLELGNLHEHLGRDFAEPLARKAHIQKGLVLVKYMYQKSFAKGR